MTGQMGKPEKKDHMEEYMYKLLRCLMCFPLVTLPFRARTRSLSAGMFTLPDFQTYTMFPTSVFLSYLISWQAREKYCSGKDSFVLSMVKEKYAHQKLPW